MFFISSSLVQCSLSIEGVYFPKQSKFECKPARLKIHLWFVPILLSSLFLTRRLTSLLLFKKCSKNAGGVVWWHARAQLGEAWGGSELGEASTSGKREAKHRLPPRQPCTVHMERFQMFSSTSILLCKWAHEGSHTIKSSVEIGITCSLFFGKLDLVCSADGREWKLTC